MLLDLVLVKLSLDITCRAAVPEERGRDGLQGGCHVHVVAGQRAAKEASNAFLPLSVLPATFCTAPAAHTISSDAHAVVDVASHQW